MLCAHGQDTESTLSLSDLWMLLFCMALSKQRDSRNSASDIWCGLFGPKVKSSHVKIKKVEVFWRKHIEVI